MNKPTQLQFKLAAKASEGPVSLTFPPEAARFNLRIDPANLAAASEAFGLGLPAAIGEAARGDRRRALCLGPDEWVLHAEAADRDAVEGAFAALYARVPHSLVDISDREITIAISGPQAATLLTVGCPMNIAEIAVGAGTRTVFDGAQVVLVRDAETSFQLEVWRTFVPHVWDLLNTANSELAAGL